MKKVFVISCLFLAALGLYLRNMYLSQDGIILRSTPLCPGHHYAWEVPFKEIFIETPDGQNINGLLFLSKTPSKGVILFLHGRGHNLGELWGFRAQDYTRYGYDVFSIDYRGFGKSTGSTTEATLLEDSDLAYEYLRQHYSENDIVVYGQSLGSGFATYVASKHTPRMLILEAPYYSMLDMAIVMKPYVPEFLLSFLLKYHIRSDIWIKNVTVPVHIFHGTRDRTIPYSSGQKLFALVQSQGQFYTLQEWGHDGIMHHPQYIETMNEILGVSRQMFARP